MKKRRIALAPILLVLLAFPSVASNVEAAAGKTRSGAVKPRRRASPTPLVWHLETLEGGTISSRLGDQPINPASVIKVATTWWALEKLGPEFRFETRFLARGTVDPVRGVLDGDLAVEGSGDPDFQTEHALLVASALNELRVKRVTGELVVNKKFWTGWEGGSAGVDPDPVKRGLLMAGRLRRTLEPNRWDRRTHAAWRDLAARRGLNAKARPGISIEGGLRVDDTVKGELLLSHRSKPLAATLRRFNCFSNNDIERVGSLIGSPSELGYLLNLQLEPADSRIRLETTSGLGENRLTPRQVVHILGQLRATAGRLGIGVESLLPVAGCDPGTVTRFFPSLSNRVNFASLVGKTGTLTSTDGGVSVLAGFLNTAQGVMVFCVAAPHAAGRLRTARRAEERWVLDLLAQHGGPLPFICAPPLAAPENGAEIVQATLPQAALTPAPRVSAGRTSVGAEK